MVEQRNFLSITDISKTEMLEVLGLAKKLKGEIKTTGANLPLLVNKQMVMIFEKPSLRTKLSFDIGFNQLGGHSIYFGPQEIGLGVRESISDVAKVISSVADLIVARVFSHKDLEELAQNSSIPVINALSDLEHPCQIMADFLTISEVKGNLENLSLAFIGDGENNVTHSLALGCALAGMDFRCASPSGYTMNPMVFEKAQKLSMLSGASIVQTEDIREAVSGADIVYTDTWVSMGDEDKEKRLKIFKPYQVNQELIMLAKKDAIFMHDLPAYRGNEVTTEVIDGPQSVVFQQAENRLHVQKALMLFLMGK